MAHDDARDQADRRVRSALQSAFEHSSALSPRPEFVADLTAHLRATASRPRPRLITARSVTAIAASLLVVAATAFGVRQWIGEERFWALARAAVGDHRNCAVEFHLAERSVSLEEGARRFDAAYRSLVAVQPSPAELTGGALTVLKRHSCVFEGRRFAHLVLQYRGGLVSVLVSADRLATIPSTIREVDGMRVASYRSGGHVVFVVSPWGDEDTRQIADAIAGPVVGALAIANPS